MSRPVAGLTQCPQVGLFHDWNDHPNEVTTCDHCGQHTECVVTCHSPKSGDIVRKCLTCRDKLAAEQSQRMAELAANLKFTTD